MWYYLKITIKNKKKQKKTMFFLEPKKKTGKKIVFFLKQASFFLFTSLGVHESKLKIDTISLGSGSKSQSLEMIRESGGETPSAQRFLRCFTKITQCLDLLRLNFGLKGMLWTVQSIHKISIKTTEGHKRNNILSHPFPQVLYVRPRKKVKILYKVKTFLKHAKH